MVRPGLEDDAVIDGALAGLAGWLRVGNTLRCRYRLPSFDAAVEITNEIARIAELLDHHPEWCVAYRELDLLTSTHDAGGITRLDLDLAARIAQLAEQAGAEVLEADAVPDRSATWVPPGHFYSPIVDVAEVRADAERLFAPGLHDLPEVDLRIDSQLQLARELARFYGEEDFPDQKLAGRRYCLDNEYFPYGDAFVYYALLRHLQPKRVIEVGAGWSSAVLLDTDERFLGGRTDCAFVEPFPERLLSLMQGDDAERTRLLRRRLQDVPLDEFRRLEANDVLFIDSSHVAKTGSDLLYALFSVLPSLAAGVVVHFHDIHANFEYPREWVEQARSWNEDYFLRAFLMHNRDWAIELHAATLAECAAAELLPLMPRIGENVGGSLWLRKLGGASGASP